MSTPSRSKKPKFTQRLIRGTAAGFALSVPLAALATQDPNLGISAVQAASMALASALAIEFSADIAEAASSEEAS